MILFAISLIIIYVGIVGFSRPAPKSLRTASPSLLENIRQVKASLCVGIILLIIHLVVTRYTFRDIDRSFIEKLGLSNTDPTMLFPFQLFTSIFIHANFKHLCSNLVYIGISSLLEREIGSKRYLEVLMIAGLTANLSIFFYHEPTISCGISGGIFGLLAAACSDKKMTLIQSFGLVAALLVITMLPSWLGSHKITYTNGVPITTDHIAHVLGALAGFIYCRLVPAE